jgi:hypothetical protein
MLQLIVAISILYILYRIVRGSWAAARVYYRGREEATESQTPSQVSNILNNTIGAVGFVFMSLVLFALFGRQLIAFSVMTVMVGICILFWIFFIGLIRAIYQSLTTPEEAMEAE